VLSELGITRLDVAGCGWATVAAGSHLGSQFGYFPAEDGPAAGVVIGAPHVPMLSW